MIFLCHMPKPAITKKIKPLQLVALVFFTVSGGPYGLEPLLSYAGEHAAFIIILITPLLWDVPAIFTVLELNSMMPITGGYYKWVRYALGTRWGFYEGWWTWIYTFVDLAIYPVLFVTYAAFFFPGIEEYRIQVCLLIVWLSAGLNVLGVVPVGRTALFKRGRIISAYYINCNSYSSAWGQHQCTFTIATRFAVLFLRDGLVYRYVELPGLGQYYHVCRGS
jgi:amino acid transporter